MCSTLKILGHQLEKIDVICHRETSQNLDFGDSTNAWNKWVNIRELDFGNCSIEDAREIMAAPKGHLKSLCVNPNTDWKIIR